MNLSSNRLCGVWDDGHGLKGTYTAKGITAIANALKANASMTELKLSCNSLKDEGVIAICKALQSNKETKLASLDIARNGIGAAGAKAVMAMAAVVGSMTRLDVRGNYLGEGGRAALRKALEGRSGFELLL